MQAINESVLLVLYFCFWSSSYAGRDSVAGTATRYGLDGPGIECW
jgi:hypothetical protein